MRKKETVKRKKKLGNIVLEESFVDIPDFQKVKQVDLRSNQA